jgi:hypothetical protein
MRHSPVQQRLGRDKISALFAHTPSVSSFLTIAPATSSESPQDLHVRKNSRLALFAIDLAGLEDPKVTATIHESNQTRPDGSPQSERSLSWSDLVLTCGFNSTAKNSAVGFVANEGWRRTAQGRRSSPHAYTMRRRSRKSKITTMRRTSIGPPLGE